MKNIFLTLLVIVFFILGCAEPGTIEKEREIIIREQYGLPNTAQVVQVWPQPETVGMRMKEVVDELLDGRQLYAAWSTQTPEDDFNDGIMYINNSYTSNGIIHTLDLSTLVGGEPSQVYFIVEWVSGCQDETFNVHFRPKGYNVDYVTGQARYNDTSNLVSTITNADGEIEWYHSYGWPYWSNPSCEPGFEVYKYMEVVVYCVFYTNGVTVN